MTIPRRHPKTLQTKWFPWRTSMSILVAIFTLVGTAGCAAASTARAAKQVHGAAHILLYNINSDGPHYRAVVTGAISDYGPAVTVYPNGKVDPGHSHQMELQLKDGTFRLSIASLEKEFFSRVEHGFVPSACSHYSSFETPVPIVGGSGTGAYTGITGSFDITVTADEVHRPCRPPFSGPPSWEVIVLAGGGTIST